MNAQQPSQQAWHTLSQEATLDALQTTESGLSQKEIETRRKHFGLNRLPEVKAQSAFTRFFLQFHNILIYILLAAALLSSLLENYLDASVILGVVIINAIIGFVQEGKSANALEAIRKMLILQTTVLRNGQRQIIDAKELVPGDIVLLKAGDKVPADCHLLTSKNLYAQEAPLTGESNPVAKEVSLLPDNTALADRHNMLYSGTTLTYGVATAVVVAIALDTELGKISSLISRVTKLNTPLLQQMDKFGWWLSGFILSLAIFTIIIGVFVREFSFPEMFMAAVALSVAAIPEGLPAILTITLAIGVINMARRHAIIRQLPAVETMGAVSVICTDKTGTLTRNELTVQHCLIRNNNFFITGSGYNNEGHFSLEDKKIRPKNFHNIDLVTLASILCNDAELHKKNNEFILDGSPMDGALLSLALKAETDPNTIKKMYPRIDFIPFESEHKYMATLNKDEKGNHFIFAKGAPEKIIQFSKFESEQETQKNIDKNYWKEQSDRLAEQGYRVLAIAYRPIDKNHTDLVEKDLNQGLTMLALLGIIDPPRQHAKEAVAQCQEAGIRVIMITGDHAITAKAIGKKIGLNKKTRTLSGNELDKLSDAELAAIIDDVDIFARTTPQHKLRLVTALQAKNHIVAMTGDGVNDAPAVKRAEIGIAMGIKGTETTKEAAEMVLTNDKFAAIRDAVEQGRVIYDNLKKAIIYILPTSAGEALAIVLAILFGLQLPITAVQILWINMVTTVTLSLTLGFQAGEINVMKRKPRNPHESLLSPLLIWRTVFVCLLFLSGVFGLFLYEISLGTTLNTARTVVANTLVIAEIAYLFNCRRLFDKTYDLSGIFGSRAVLIAIAIVIFLQILFTHLPVMQLLFSTTPLSVEQWSRIILFGFFVYFAVEFEKFFQRSRANIT